MGFHYAGRLSVLRPLRVEIESKGGDRHGRQHLAACSMFTRHKHEYERIKEGRTTEHPTHGAGLAAQLLYFKQNYLELLHNSNLKMRRDWYK